MIEVVLIEKQNQRQHFSPALAADFYIFLIIMMYELVKLCLFIIGNQIYWSRRSRFTDYFIDIDGIDPQKVGQFDQELQMKI